MNEPEMTVRMCGRYIHNETGEGMNLVAASVPEQDDFVELWDRFPAEGFRKVWKGDWEKFHKEWRLKEV